MSSTLPSGPFGVKGATRMRIERIGDATLYLADCRDVVRNIPDKSVDFIFTDPPYGHNNNNGDLISKWESALGKGDSGECRPILNDGAEANDLFRSILPEFNRILPHGGCCCCCCCGGGPDPQFARWSLWLDEEIGFKQMIVWDKGPMGMGWHYRRSYETVLVAEKRGAACRWFDVTGKVENIIRPGAYGIRKIIPSKEEHPTPKPVELPAAFIRFHTKSGQTVFDPFMGGGSTGIAAIHLGRKFIGIELDERWFDLSCARIARAHSQPLFADLSPREVQEEMQI